MNLATDLYPKYDIIVVGGGIAGLVAAYEVYKRDPSLRVKILEGKNRIGGQILSDVIGELGARWISTDQRHILALCNELNVQLFTSAPEKDYRNISDLDNDSLWSTLPKFEVNRFFSMLDVICQDSRLSSSHTIPMEDFLCQHLFFTSSRNNVRLLVRSVCGLESHEITARDFLSVCRSWMGCSVLFKSLIGDMNNKRILMPNFSIIIERLESQIDPETIMKNQIVKNVIQYNGFARVQTECNQTFLTRFVVFAIPEQSIPLITFIPTLPDHFAEYRSPHYVTSFCANYSAPFWKLLGYSGSSLCSNQYIVTYESKENTISGLMYHKEISSNSKLVVKDILLKYLCQRFGEVMNEPRLWVQTTWEQSQIVNEPTSSTWNRIIWTSTYDEGAYKGYANGSVQSGKKAALIALLGLRPQMVSWEDIADVKPANVVKTRIGLWQQIAASINLYNSVYYAIVTPICYLGFGYLWKKCLVKLHDVR
ncbi:probable flavin-containing monoamine oxidase A [Bradysia coprophila]|uniref:probable flavin-containing monoamine oxidase A n=1 Tax=Bradysia coprophila TaxID=38358 RepID=UPI00187D8937|nr:probable flavin-containing monoamine oxidase A [Bradysia coprophila]